MKSVKNDIENVYVIDFETRNSQADLKANMTSIWLWDICKMTNLEHIQGTTIESFIDQIKEIAPATFYSHNLKFDGSFIIYYLIKSKFEYTENSKKLESNQYTCLINDQNDVFNIKICFEKKKGSNAKRQVEFRDSSKKIRGSVKQIALSYNLPIKKLEIDHVKSRTIDYKPTSEELEYIKHDTEIIAQVLRGFYEKGMTALTAPSDALKAYKDYNKKWFKYLFPVLDLGVDQFIRYALRGGVCYLKEEYRNRILNEVTILDINSYYPYIASSMPLPYGKPLYFKGKPEFRKDMPLYIAHIEICCRLKKDHVPTLQLKKFYIFGRNEFVRDTQGELYEFYLTNVDIETIYKSYDVFEINYIDGFYFCASTKLFKDYIEPLYKIKDNTIGAQRETNKILLNSLFGKFATKTVFKDKAPYLLNDVIHYEDLGEEMTNPVYTAITVFINSWGRALLASLINLNYQTFIYCDTDSLHLVGNISNTNYSNVDIDEHRLGAFKNEYLKNPIVNAKYLNEKTYYLILKSGDSVIKCSGAPDDVKKMMTFDNFKYDSVFNNKLVPKFVKGGCILVNSKFSIKDNKKG